MKEKLNIPFISSNKKFNQFEIELFIELLNNQIHFDQILEIMKLDNNEINIIKYIDSNNMNYIIDSKDELSKVHRFNWALNRKLNHNRINDSFKKAFTYPIFLWLLSLNLLTFLLINILPTMLQSFSQFTNTTNIYDSLIKLSQLLIGVEWGIILLGLGIKLKINNNQILKLYEFIYKHYPDNLWVYYFSYHYLFDFLYLVNLDIHTSKILSILNRNDSILFQELSRKVLFNLNEGKSFKESFDLLDITFIKILKIDDFDRKLPDRLSNYLNVLIKLIELNIKKYANYCMTFVYIQIGFMVVLVYSVLLYPLKLIEEINL